MSSEPRPATVLAGGVFDLFPDFRGEKRRIEPESDSERLARRCACLADAREEEAESMQPWDRPCIHGGFGKTAP